MQIIISNGPFSQYIAHRENMKQNQPWKPHKLHLRITHSAQKESSGGVITYFPPSFAYDQNVLS